MIFTDRTITVRKGTSSIDEPIVVYRGDYELEVRFKIVNSKFRFMSGTNLIESEKASYGQMAILTPYGGNIFSQIARCSDGAVTFMLSADMLNQIEEVGLYSFQIRLFDYNKESRVSIPPIEFGLEVREPITSEDHDNSVNNAIVGYSIAKVVNPSEEKVEDTFDGDGNYNKTNWETGDRISEGKLNKIEDAIDKVNKNDVNNTATLSKRIENNFNLLNSIKADNVDVDNIQTQINNLVVNASGDSNPEVIQARGEFETLNDRITNDNKSIYNTIDENRKYIDSITSTVAYLSKDIAGYLTNLPMRIGSIYQGQVITGNKTRCCLVDPVVLPVNAVITLKDYNNFKWAVYGISENGNILVDTGWKSEKYAVTAKILECAYVYIQLAYKDDRIIYEEDLKVLSDQLIIENVHDSRITAIERDMLYTKTGIYNQNVLHSDIGVKINSGSYYQQMYDSWDKSTSYLLYVKTNDYTGSLVDCICLREGTLVDRNMYRSNARYIGDGIYIVDHTTSNDETTNNYEILIDLRFSTMTIDNVELSLMEIRYDTPTISSENALGGETGEIVLYVAPNGDDANSGVTNSKPLATIKKAIEMGATTVLCKRGDYYNQPPISYTSRYGQKLKIIPYEPSDFNQNIPDRPLINLICGDKLDSLVVTTNGLLSQVLEPNGHIKSVFVDKTTQPIDTTNGRSPGYYSTIWQLHNDNTLDKKLKPVLTLAECESESGTFHYDGMNVYINPFSSPYESFVVPHNHTPITLNGFSELVLEDIVVSFGYQLNFNVSNNMNMTIRNCHSKYAALADGFRVDNSNCNFYNCTSFKSRNDGFNIHGYGESNFYNCSGYYNYDDGISHHDGCVGVIDGGEWHHNGKGGVSSPTHGAHIDIYNIESHNNRYGVYAISDSTRRPCSGRVFNSVLYSNTDYDFYIGKSTIKTYNTKYTSKYVGTNGTLNEL